MQSEYTAIFFPIKLKTYYYEWSHSSETGNSWPTGYIGQLDHLSKLVTLDIFRRAEVYILDFLEAT